MFVRIAKVNWFDGPAETSHLNLPPRLVLDSIGEKTFLTDGSHIDQRTMDATRQKFLTEAGQRGGFCSAEQVRRDGKIELIDEPLFQHGAKKSGSAFTRKRADFVSVAQRLQHRSKINLLRVG